MDQNILEKHMAVLGVEWGACAQTVKAAWRKKIKATHPDRNPGVPPFAILAVNEAFEVLKGGVPHRKSPPTTAQAAQARRPAAPEPYQGQPLHQYPIQFDRKAQAAMAALAAEKLAYHKHPLPPRTLAQKLTGKPARYVIQTPHEYIRMWRRVIVELDDKTTPAGDSYIALPILALRKGELVPTDDVALYWRRQEKEQKLRPKAHPVLSKMILPESLSHFEVWLFTRSDTRFH